MQCIPCNEAPVGIFQIDLHPFACRLAHILSRFSILVADFHYNQLMELNLLMMHRNLIFKVDLLRKSMLLGLTVINYKRQYMLCSKCLTLRDDLLCAPWFLRVLLVWGLISQSLHHIVIYTVYIHTVKTNANNRGCQSCTKNYLMSSFLLLWILCAGRKLPA